MRVGRLLHVGVDEADVIAACRLHAGVQRRFLAEIAGEVDGLHGMLAACGFHHAPQKLRGAVLAAVVHEHDLDGRAGLLEALGGRFVEQRDVVRLVVTGDNQRQVVQGVAHVFVPI